MKTRVALAEQVEQFVRALAPGPKQELRRALKALLVGTGLDVKALQGNLVGYSRLRVTHFRVIYWERAQASERVIECVFAQRRNVVYELFAELLKNELPL